MGVRYDDGSEGFEERGLADESLRRPTEPLLVAGGADIATTGSGGCDTTTSDGREHAPPGFEARGAASWQPGARPTAPADRPCQEDASMETEGTDKSVVTVMALDSADATLERVGGKGVSLARMAAAGLPVPPGFHVTTAAYRRFVAANDLQPLLLEAASRARADDPGSLDGAAVAIGE